VTATPASSSCTAEAAAPDPGINFLHPTPVCCRGFASMAVGLRPDVDIFEGAACEFVLGLLLAFIVTLSTHFKSRWAAVDGWMTHQF
jgi:hypothetical protein